MSEDLSEFHAVFFEEADELIENMEAELLEMLGDPSDPERVNTVFRAAHSIKGGSATFGFDQIAKFTHVMETLLDQVREGTKQPSPDLIDLQLRSTDCLRVMMAAAKGEAEPDDVLAAQLLQELETMLQEQGDATPDSEPDAAPDSPSLDNPSLDSPSRDSNSQTWLISLEPGPESLKTANDPIPILAELNNLGTATITLDQSKLPAVDDFNPEQSYLAWQIELISEADEDKIREVFDWIDVSSKISMELTTSAPDKSERLPESASTEPAASQDHPDQATAQPDNQKSADPEQKAKPPAKTKAVSSIRVGTDKIDKLINLVGELVITQSMLQEEGDKLPPEIVEKLQSGLAQLERHTRDLQENVMQIRMVPISNAFNRLPRMIHDLTNKLGKQVELTMVGEQTELDKTVLESIGDPLVHLVRNAVDHGIEDPADRIAAGKDEVGSVELHAYHEAGNIVIEIRDDGRGIDTAKVLAKAKDKGLVAPDQILPDGSVYDLLFHPGLSTADQVSDVSGRGVGMDVVRRNIQSLGGNVEVDSKLGEGSVFTIRLPLTLAIVDGQLVTVNQQTYVIPLVSIIESIQVETKQVNSIAERGKLYRLRDEYIPLVRLASLFGMHNAENSEQLMVVVESDQGKVGILVDDLLAQQQVVIKSLEANYKQVDGVAGGTILGDGTVSLILDINGVIELSRNRINTSQAA